jgi:diaminopropionate ammonia-lyase
MHGGPLSDRLDTSEWWLARPPVRQWRAPVAAATARHCHRGLPGYTPTPLVPAPEAARRWGVGSVLVKDESQRFGVASFKALGASYAIARLLAERTGEPVCSSWEEMVDQASRAPVTLVTATDGNHGRALAHFAAALGLPAEVVVPAVMSPAAIAAIAAEGARVVRTQDSYDDAVRRAAARVESGSDRVLVQDTAWEGYEVIPGWIVEGYQTMVEELDEQLHALRLREPDLVAVPVGVGSLAQAVVTFYRQGERATSVLSCEPDTAACILASLRAHQITSVPTGSTNMAGLNCGTPTSLGWPVLHAGLDAATMVSDADAVQAVRELARIGVQAGASGAASWAGVERALSGADADARRGQLGLDDGSIVVLLNTEGSADDAPCLFSSCSAGEGGHARVESVTD